MTTSEHYQDSLETAAALLGQSLQLPLGAGEPPSGADFRRLATEHTFGDSWPRSGLDVRSKALISVAIAAAIGTHEPLRGQLRIALHNGISKEEVVELVQFILKFQRALQPAPLTATRSRSPCSPRAVREARPTNDR